MKIVSSPLAHKSYFGLTKYRSFASMHTIMDRMIELLLEGVRTLFVFIHVHFEQVVNTVYVAIMRVKMGILMGARDLQQISYAAMRLQ